MSKIGEGLAIAAICAALILMHPLGWIGMLIVAAIFGAFK